MMKVEPKPKPREEELPSCARCGKPLGWGQSVVVSGFGMFHAECWRKGGVKK